MGDESVVFGTFHTAPEAAHAATQGEFSGTASTATIKQTSRACQVDESRALYVEKPDEEISRKIRRVVTRNNVAFENVQQRKKITR